MDISSLVRAVIAAFEDATKLVQRIREQRANSNGPQLPEDAVHNLLESLALGPVIVRDHFEHDLKRFGEPYVWGDIQARDQMKDVLINLQMSLIINLKTVYMDGIELDFPTLQTTSDDSRVNAGVCLGQLSQRLSGAAKAQAFVPQQSAYSSGGSGFLPPLSPSLGYSSSRSTYSSAVFQAPRTPDAMTEQFGQLSMSPPFCRPTFDATMFDDHKMSMSSAASQEHHVRPPSTAIYRSAAETHMIPPSVGVHNIDESDDRSMRRRSSQALPLDDNILLMFPRPGGQPILTPPTPGHDIDRESYVSSGQNSRAHSPSGLARASTVHRSRNSRDRFGPDDYGEQILRGDGRQFSNSTVYDLYLPRSPEGQTSMSYSSRVRASTHSSPEHVRYLQENSRAPRREPRSDSLHVSSRADRGATRHPIRADTDGPPVTRELLSRPSVSVPIPVEPSRTPPPRTPPPTGPLPQVPSLPRHAVSGKYLSSTSVPPSDQAPSIHTISSTAPSVSSTPLTNTGPLTLPTDKNLLGFCKGAFRLQAGMERKAFAINNRPFGLASMSSYWRCEKCNFEGPVHHTVNMSDDKKKKGKPEKVFDPKVRVSGSGGVRYRWAFLARCHVSLKGTMSLDAPKDGSFGSFGCIFCCAEGKNRGWLDISNAAGVVGGPVAGSKLSVKSGSGRTANSGVKLNLMAGAQATPIFGGVTSFMQHLESVHRPQEGWPNAEMAGRFRVVVGRVARPEEEGWEINFVPV
ncbi:hypothetical protein PV04_06282 [Phialophora macrospora]|uniref:Uncharacterized protein n=1 Tax=Phialophora macrospora TaxID=1851006 RepID=A0A0D2G4S9_9EURO|nr:hypothetical protein PV04_06282 [Phialophora macrospora]